MKLEEKWIPIILLFSFSLLIFLRPTLYDMDSYYFASISCGGSQPRPDIDSLFASFFYKYLDCNLLVFKGVIVSLFLLCLIIVEKIGGLINKKYSHFLPFLLGLSLTYYTFFSRMEDDTLGMPFVFGSLYYLVKYSQTKNIWDYIRAGIIIVIGFLFWKGIAIWALIALCVGPFGWILSGMILWFYQDILLAGLDQTVSESIPLAGILANGLILVGGLALPTYFIPAVALSLMLAMIKLKYALYLGLLCGLGIYFYLCKRSFFENESKKVFGFPKKQAFIGLLLIINLSGIIGIYSAPPSENLINLVHTFSIAAKDKNQTMVYNDWELGHLIAYNGLTPSNEYGPPTPVFWGKNGFVLTRQKINCSIIGSYVETYAYDCNHS